MGVKTYYLFDTGTSIYSGPAAYYKLVSIYKRQCARPFEALQFKNKAWRKCIGPLYTRLRQEARINFGVLRVLRTTNKMKDTFYRDSRRIYKSKITKPKNPSSVRPNAE